MTAMEKLGFGGANAKITMALTSKMSIVRDLAIWKHKYVNCLSL
jgi:hypothetical protein